MTFPSAAFPQASVTFGDNVRILATADTEAKGISGLIGNVYGETTPSVTGIEVIGSTGIDYAINVHIDELSDSFWLDPSLVELVDHAAGSEITLDGVPKKWVRSATGEWVEHSTKNPGGASGSS